MDGAPHDQLPLTGWRARLAGAFQDVFRFELRAQHSVGLGELRRLDERAAAERASERASASDVIAGLAQGLDTQLGPFERFSAAVRGSADSGRLTLSVSHRFSTVRMPTGSWCWTARAWWRWAAPTS